MIRKTGKATEGRKTELARGGHKKDELVNKQKNRGMRTAHWSGAYWDSGREAYFGTGYLVHPFYGFFIYCGRLSLAKHCARRLVTSNSRALVSPHARNRFFAKAQNPQYK